MLKEVFKELTRDQAAIILGMTPAGVDQLRRVGRKNKVTGEYERLIPIRKGRFALADVIRFKKEKDVQSLFT